MADLVGIQIKDLTPASSLSNTTEFAVQRQGVEKAEKTTLLNLNNYVLNSPTFSNFVETSVNSKLNIHIANVDPHGDRVYTNTLFQNHVTGTDPHGDRAYTDTKITTSLNAHTVATDAHGDRAFSVTKIQEHVAAVDSHGDRAYADGKDVVTLGSANTYTDTQINTHVTTKIGTTIAPLVSGKIPDAFINKQITFDAKLSFPVTGNESILYVDKTNDDIYRWNGSTYKNLTPEFSGETANLTTDIVAEGTNVDRKYLTSVLKTNYDAKLDNVVNNQVLTNANNLVKEKIGNNIKLRNIKSESNINLTTDSSDAIVITDNTYKYSKVTSNNIFNDLVHNTETKTDILKTMLDTSIYEIVGETSCVTYEESSNVKYVTNSEIFKINALIGKQGVLESIAIPSNLSINSLGNIVTGNATASKVIKIYNKLFQEIATANVLGDGTFTASLSTAITDGSPIYIYTVDGSFRSKDVKIYTPNLVSVKEVSLLSVDSTKLILKGIAEKNSTISVTKVDATVIGTGTTTTGNFEITLTEVVDADQTINIKTTNAFNVERTDQYVVKIANIIAPYEVFVNKERTEITGKGDINSTITVLNDLTVLGTISTGISGTFNQAITIPTNINFIIIEIEKGVDTYVCKLILNPYEDETNKPKENLMVVSNDFNLIINNTSKLNATSNFEMALYKISGNDFGIKVKNTLGKTTTWLTTLKINKIDL